MFIWSLADIILMKSLIEELDKKYEEEQEWLYWRQKS